MYIGRLIKPQPFKLVTESRGLRVAYHSVSARSRDPFQQVVRKRKLPCCFVVKPTQKETAPNEPEVVYFHNAKDRRWIHSTRKRMNTMTKICQNIFQILCSMQILMMTSTSKMLSLFKSILLKKTRFRWILKKERQKSSLIS